MGLTQAQREARRKTLGASEFAAVMGKDPYKTAIDVWASKTLGVDVEESWPMRVGTALEPLLLDDAQQMFGPVTRRGEWVHHPRFTRITCTLDGYIESEGCPVQAKCVGVMGRMPKAEVWGPDWSDEIPERVWVQNMVEIACCGSSRGKIVAQIMTERRHYETTLYDLDKVELIMRAGDAWFQRHVIGGESPDVFEPVDAAIFAAIKDRPGETIELNPVLLERWRQAVADRATLKEAWDLAENAKKAVRDAIRIALGGCEFGIFPCGTKVQLKVSDVKPSKGHTQKKLILKGED